MHLLAMLDTMLDRSLLGYSKVGYLLRRPGWDAFDPAPGALSGKVAIVTGAKTGLGRSTATGLARLGARVHLLIRDDAEGQTAQAQIERAAPAADIRVDECDVSVLADVRAYAVTFSGPLHVLIHNAGVMPTRREMTREGNELSLATHALGPHLLTTMLLPALTADPPSRIIWVTSGAMYAQRLHLDDLQYELSRYRRMTGYTRTKRIQAILAREWATRLVDQGVVVHAAHPGWADTPGGLPSRPRLRSVIRPLLRTADQGADTFVWLAASDLPGRSTGLLWHDRRPRPYDYTRRTRVSRDERHALWDICQRLTAADHPRGCTLPNEVDD